MGRGGIAAGCGEHPCDRLGSRPANRCRRNLARDSPGSDGRHSGIRMTIAVRKLQPMATAQTKALLHSVKSPSFEMSCFTLTDYAQKRRARDSNPQPVSRHHISSVAASHSLTLRMAAVSLGLRATI